MEEGKKEDSKRVRVLFCGDLVTPTGFSTVNHAIIENLDKKFEVIGLGINYFGDPHPYKFPIFPASSKGDLYGLNRLDSILDMIQPELIFILNDVWVIDKFLEKIESHFKDKKESLPKVVVYFPVDAEEHDSEWYQHFDDVVSCACVYTQFGKKVASKAKPLYSFGVVPHGVDNKVYFQLFENRQEAKKLLFTKENLNSLVKESFIFLNSSRNQPRKKLDLTLEAFKLFSEGKPDNVRIYMHCFAPGTNIYTNTGIKNIEDISIGDSVITHTGSTKTVANTFSREYNDKIINISSVGNEDILVTKEHPILAIHTDICNRHPVHKCLLGCGQAYKIQDTGNLAPNCKYRNYENYKPEWILAKDLKVGDYLVFKSNKLNSKVNDTSVELARLLGFFVAEGSTNKYSTMFTTSFKEDIVQEEIKTEMFDLFNIVPERYHEYKNEARTACQQHFVNKDVSEQISNWCGKGSYSKKVPPFIYNSTPEIITEFLKCFWFGDGYRNQKLGYYGFYTSSKQLAYQIKMMLETLGVYSSLRINKLSDEFSGYNITVWGKNATILAELFDSKLHKETDREYQKTYTENGMTFIPITSIKEQDYSGLVYNIEVEDDNSYIANGVVVHNCGVKDAKHIEVIKYCERLGIRERLLLTNLETGPQHVSREFLNLIYNSTDVGINSGTGEGWGLPNMEHAVTGAPQVVADHSALHELYQDCSLLVPANIKTMFDNSMTIGRLVLPEDMAVSMQQLYENKELYKELSQKGKEKFTQEQYSWNTIGKRWSDVFLGVLE
jgi:glycosyltransferase involved in cell wall biosynthesis